jgi:hypothetical protein
MINLTLYVACLQLTKVRFPVDNTQFSTNSTILLVVLSVICLGFSGGYFHLAMDVRSDKMSKFILFGSFIVWGLILVLIFILLILAWSRSERIIDFVIATWVTLPNPLHWLF